jgi:acyl carrier protein
VWQFIARLFSGKATAPSTPEGTHQTYESATAVDAKVKEVILDALKHVRPEQLVPEAEFERDLGCSMDVVEVVMACEEEFGIEIPDEDAERLGTVGKLSAYIQRRLGLTT